MNSPTHWWIRILAAIASPLFVVMGLLAIIDGLRAKPFVFDHNFRFGISSFVTGIIFSIVAIHGRIFSKK